MHTSHLAAMSSETYQPRHARNSQLPVDGQLPDWFYRPPGSSPRPEAVPIREQARLLRAELAMREFHNRGDANDPFGPSIYRQLVQTVVLAPLALPVIGGLQLLHMLGM